MSQQRRRAPLPRRVGKKRRLYTAGRPIIPHFLADGASQWDKKAKNLSRRKVTSDTRRRGRWTGEGYAVCRG